MVADTIKATINPGISPSYKQKHYLIAPTTGSPKTASEHDIPASLGLRV